jgi:hypothetical protein
MKPTQLQELLRLITRVVIKEYASMSSASTTDVDTTSTTHAFQIGPDAGARLAIDANEIHALNGASYATLLLNELGGDVNVGASTSTVTIAGTLSAATVAAGTTTTAASGVGYMGIPQVIINSNASARLFTVADSGKHLYAIANNVQYTINAAAIFTLRY